MAQLNIESSTDSSVRQFGQHPFSQHDTRVIRRVLTTAEQRCRLLSQRPCAREVGMQVAVRSAVLTKNSSREEKRAVGKLCSSALEARDEAQRAGINLRPADSFPRSLQVPDWMDGVGWDEIGGLETFLKTRTPSQMAELGHLELPEMFRALGRKGDSSSDVEKAIKLAGARKARINGVHRPHPRANWDPISEETVARIRAKLECAGPGGITARAGKAIGAESGLPELLTQSAWLTGMRPCELFSFRLVAVGIDPRRCATPGDAATASEAVRRADLQAFGPVSVADAIRGMAADGPREEGGPTFMLLIRSLKVVCTSPKLRSPVRVQYLDGLSRRDIEVLHRASLLHRLELDRLQVERIRNTCNQAIGTAASGLLPERRDRVTLNTFRHAFIDLARQTMPIAGIAALTGHTLQEGVRWYGRRNARYSRNRQPCRWMPAPDPVRVAEISRVWAEKQAEPALRSELEPLPEPTPWDM